MLISAVHPSDDGLQTLDLDSSSSSEDERPVVAAAGRLKQQQKKKHHVPSPSQTESEEDDAAATEEEVTTRKVPKKTAKKPAVPEEKPVKVAPRKRPAAPVVTAEEPDSGSENDLVDKVEEEPQREVRETADELVVKPPGLFNGTYGGRVPLKQVHPPPAKTPAASKKAKKAVTWDEAEATEDAESDAGNLSNISPVRARDPPNAPVRSRATAGGSKKGKAPLAKGKRGAKEALSFESDEDDQVDLLIEKAGVRQALVRKIEKRQEARTRAKNEEEVKAKVRGIFFNVLHNLK